MKIKTGWEHQFSCYYPVCVHPEIRLHVPLALHNVQGLSMSCRHPQTLTHKCSQVRGLPENTTLHPRGTQSPPECSQSLMVQTSVSRLLNDQLCTSSWAQSCKAAHGLKDYMCLCFPSFLSFGRLWILHKSSINIRFATTVSAVWYKGAESHGCAREILCWVPGCIHHGNETCCYKIKYKLGLAPHSCTDKPQQVLAQQSQRLFLGQVDHLRKVKKVHGISLFHLVILRPRTSKLWLYLSLGPHRHLSSAGTWGVYEVAHARVLQWVKPAHILAHISSV